MYEIRRKNERNNDYNVQSNIQIRKNASRTRLLRRKIRVARGKGKGKIDYGMGKSKTDLVKIKKGRKKTSWGGWEFRNWQKNCTYKISKPLCSCAVFVCLLCKIHNCGTRSKSGKLG